VNSFAQKTWDGGAGTTNWGDGNNWNPNGVPGATDAVTIGNGFTVIVNTSPITIASLTVGGGASGLLTMGNNNNNRALTVTGNVIVNSGATFNTAGNGGNTVTIGGNLTNSGTFDMNIGGADCEVTFNGTANQTITGTGGTTDFNTITINNSGAANNNIVEVMPSNFTAAGGFLTLTRGILKMSGSYTFANTFFNTASPVINSDEGIWLNNSNVTVTGQGGDTELSGLIRITAGTYNVGTGSDWWLFYNSGAVVTIEGGALNVSGAFFGFLLTSSITYTQSNGIVTVNTAGNTGAFGSVPSFGIEEPTSVFNMSGGSIVLQRLDDAYTDYINLSTSATVTGGTVQVGNAASPVPASSYWVNSTPPIYNLVVNTTNTPTCELRVNTTVLNDVTIGGGLDVSPNNVNMNVGHNWTNNGTFTPGTATVTFDGTALQQIGGTSATTFTNLTANNTAGNTTTGITLQQDITVTGTLTLTSGHITSSSTNLLTMNAGSNVAGANYATRISGGSDNSFVNGPIRKIGNTNFLFPVGKINAGHHFAGISSPANPGDTYTIEYIRGSARLLGTVSVAGLSHVSNCEYWDISTTAGSPNVDVTLSWTGTSNCNAAVYVNDLPSLVAAHFAGGTWSSYGGTVDGGSTASAGSLTWNGVTTFSPFSLGSTDKETNPLPVKLVNVKAYRSGNRNKIEWTNLTETAVDVYEVQRSVTGTSFETMSSVAARGNTNAREDYFGFDPQTSPVTYYRIKVIGNDGKISYSPVVKVNGNDQDQQKLVLYPNPVTGKQFTIQMNSAAGDYQVRIFGANGQVVKMETLKHPGGAYSKTIELPSQLQAGQYYLQVSGGEQMLTTKFIIQ